MTLLIAKHQKELQKIKDVVIVESETLDLSFNSGQTAVTVMCKKLAQLEVHLMLMILTWSGYITSSD